MNGRRSAVETLFAQHLPYFRLDNAIAVAFINETESLVQEAIDAAKDKLRGAKLGDKQNGSKAASPNAVASFVKTETFPELTMSLEREHH